MDIFDWSGAHINVSLALAALVTFPVSFALIFGTLYWAFHKRLELKNWFPGISTVLPRKVGFQPPEIVTMMWHIGSAREHVINGFAHFRRRKPTTNYDEETRLEHGTDTVELHQVEK